MGYSMRGWTELSLQGCVVDGRTDGCINMAIYPPTHPLTNASTRASTHPSIHPSSTMDGWVQGRVPGRGHTESSFRHVADVCRIFTSATACHHRPLWRDLRVSGCFGKDTVAGLFSRRPRRGPVHHWTGWAETGARGEGHVQDNYPARTLFWDSLPLFP